MNAADERLWFTMDDCEGRHFVIGNAHTHPGRLRAWCPTRDRAVFVSKDEMTSMSDRLAIWMEGFLAGALPPPPDDAPPTELAEWSRDAEEFATTGVFPLPGSRSRGPIDDAPRAAAIGMTFFAATRSKRGEQWIDMPDDFAQLQEALRAAETSDAPQAAVFTGSGFLYWTSEAPDQFNSSVVWTDAE